MMRKLLPTSSQRRLTVLAGIGLLPVAGFLAFVALPLPGGPVAIRNDTGSVGCYLSGVDGDLVIDADAGTAIVEANGHRWPVIWQRAWTGRQSGSEVEVLDHYGAVAYRTGSHVHLMGGYDQGGWLACRMEPVSQ